MAGYLSDDHEGGNNGKIDKETKSNRSHQFYDVDEAVKLLKEAATAKFDETVELAFNLNINPKYADQQLRGATVLPHGTGKSKKVLVFAKDQKEEDAKAAGADYVGGKNWRTKLPRAGWILT